MPVLGFRQPRHFVFKEFERWLNEAGLAFVAAPSAGAALRASLPSSAFEPNRLLKKLPMPLVPAVAEAPCTWDE